MAMACVNCHLDKRNGNIQGDATSTCNHLSKNFLFSTHEISQFQGIGFQIAVKAALWMDLIEGFAFSF